MSRENVEESWGMRGSGALAGAERGLVVTDAPNWLVGKLLRGEPANELRVIADLYGHPIGRFELEEQNLLDKGIGMLFAMSGSAHASGRTHRVNVLDSTGEAQLRLTMNLRLLAVHDPDGKAIGEVRATSRINDKRTRAEFRVPRRRRFDLSKGGRLLASMDGEHFDPIQPQRPVRWQIVDTSGTEVAVAEHTAERRNRLTIHRRLAEPLHTLVVAFGIAMFDRYWLQIPTSSGGGV